MLRAFSFIPFLKTGNIRTYRTGEIKMKEELLHETSIIYLLFDQKHNIKKSNCDVSHVYVFLF